jgi:hypothetical protein
MAIFVGAAASGAVERGGASNWKIQPLEQFFIKQEEGRKATRSAGDLQHFRML